MYSFRVSPPILNSGCTSVNTGHAWNTDSQTHLNPDLVLHLELKGMAFVSFVLLMSKVPLPK